MANQFFSNDESKLNIIAVGGYGRGEFYPKSDTDLLILLDKNTKNHLKNNISKFLTFLWDIGIEASLLQCQYPKEMSGILKYCF